MTAAPRFSIIINNYNYSRFLARTIESCLAQDYAEVEIVVVDDGSTDDSREIAAGFGQRVVPVFKENGGQASAFHAGFAVSTGEYVLFLDADDALRPDAVRHMVAGFREPHVSKVQCRMRLIDAEGEVLGEEPAGALASGDWKAKVLRYGPSAYPSVPSSASAYPRWLVERIFPMPEAGFRVAADSYLKNVAPLFGVVVSLQETLVDYRIHGGNTSYWGWEDDPRGRFTRDVSHYELACEAIARWANDLGHVCTKREFVEGRWQHLVRKHTLFRLGGGDEFRVPLPVAMRAALDGSAWKRPFVLLAVAFIYLGPAKAAGAFVVSLFRKNKIGQGLAGARPRSARISGSPLVAAEVAT
jgi:glycosyltransferase involved in cell wall biosynthesis